MITNFQDVFGFPRPPPGLVVFQKNSQIQHLVVFTAKVYFSETTESNISKGKGIWGKVWGNQVKESSPSGITQDMLNSSSNKMGNYVFVCQRISLERRSTQGFLLEVGHIGTLCIPCQNFRLSEEKQVLCINHILCTESLGIMSHSYH